MRGAECTSDLERMTTWRERRQKVEEEVFGGEDVNWSGRGEAIMHSVNWHPFPKVGGWLGSDFEKQAGEIGCGQGLAGLAGIARWRWTLE